MVSHGTLCGESHCCVVSHKVLYGVSQSVSWRRKKKNCFSLRLLRFSQMELEHHDCLRRNALRVFCVMIRFHFSLRTVEVCAHTVDCLPTGGVPPALWWCGTGHEGGPLPWIPPCLHQCKYGWYGVWTHSKTRVLVFNTGDSPLISLLALHINICVHTLTQWVFRT